MNHIERRDKGMAYISDEAVFEQQKKCRQLLQKFVDAFNIIQGVINEELQLGDDAKLMTHTITQLETDSLRIVVDVLHNFFCLRRREYTKICTDNTHVRADTNGAY